MAGIWRDARLGIRSLLKNPGFAALAILTLALGIGANTAIFSVTDAAVLHPLPYPQPDRIVALYRTNAAKGQEDDTFSRSLFDDLRGKLPAVEDLAGYHAWPVTITGPGEPTETGSIASSASMFHLLGIRPVLGRAFSHSESERGAAPVALISETVWQERYSGERNVIGKAINLSGEAYTIVGVFPGNLRFPHLNEPPAVWVPLATDPAIKALAGSLGGAENISYLSVAGRLKPGATLAQAQAQADVTATALVRKDPQDRAGMGLRAAVLEREVSRNYRAALAALLGAVGLVLLVACANIANLLLARATARQREMALRLALGAGRGGIWRQMLVESVELAVVGGGLGAYLAYLAVTNLRHLIPASLTLFDTVTVNGAVLGYAAALSLGAAIVFGSLPAWGASRLDVYKWLKEGGRGTSGTGGKRLREALVVVEVALAVTLLVGAGLLLRSFSRLLASDPGFQAKGVALALVNLPRGTYSTPQQWNAFYARALERMRGEPGVSEVAAAVSVPMGGAVISLTYTVAGQPAPPEGREPVADYRPVTPGYFGVMRIPLVEGRDFAARDATGSAPVCIINRELARVSFRGIEPLGHSVVAGGQKPCQVVGVVGDVKTTLGLPPEAAIYGPLAQSPFWTATFVARGGQSADALIPGLRDAVRSVDPTLPVDVGTLAGRVDHSAQQEQFRTTLVGIFAGLAIVLAAIGISGVLAYSVSRRTQEIGVRMALGAQPRTVLAQVVKEGLRLVGIGAAVGMAGALGVMRLMSSLLYGVGPADPLTYIGAAVLLLVVALAACALPALRAARVSPTVALRYE